MHQPDPLSDPFENALRSINGSYALMLELLELFEPPQTTFSAERFASQLAELNALQTKIEDQELQLSRLPAAEPKQAGTIARLIEEKKELVEQLISRNRSVIIQARAVQSYLLDELQQASAGYVALKGYRSSDNERGYGYISKSI